MRKYDLARMLEEIRREDSGGEAPKPADTKKVLTQEQIKAMARARRKPAAPKTTDEK